MSGDLTGRTLSTYFNLITNKTTPLLSVQFSPYCFERNFSAKNYSDPVSHHSQKKFVRQIQYLLGIVRVLSLLLLKVVVLLPVEHRSCNRACDLLSRPPTPIKLLQKPIKGSYCLDDKFFSDLSRTYIWYEKYQYSNRFSVNVYFLSKIRVIQPWWLGGRVVDW